MTVKTLIIRTAGTNCDRELAHAFELAGSAVDTVHLNQLLKAAQVLEQVDVIAFPGGFSYGDDIAAGRILANRLRHRLLEPLRDAVQRGVAVIGICNGFQVLVKLGLLPDPNAPQMTQTVTLSDNTCGRFVDRWVRLHGDRQSTCIWTRGLDELGLPIAHGEGRFVCESDQLLEQLRRNGQVALRYDPADNPNGSVDDIAGICDPSGLILGLMPHPERYVHPTHHPQWARHGAAADREPAGLGMLRNAVNHMRQSRQPAAAN
jgi:phosphoribosylformylglycinamidine synthase